MTRTVCLALLSALFWLAPRAAFALGCKGTPYALDVVDKSWTQDADPPSIDDDRLKVKPPAQGKTLIYRGVPLPEGEICVTLRSPNRMSDPSATEAGPVFMAWQIPGSSGYRFFALSPNGDAALRDCTVQPGPLLSSGQPAKQHADASSTSCRTTRRWPDVEGARKGPGGKNELRARWWREESGGGIGVSLWVNSTKLALDLSLEYQLGGGEVGLRAVSEKGRIDTWKFSDFTATDLP